MTQANALGVWTSADCALVLIDFQKEMFQSIRSETGADLVELHVRLLARTAKAFNVPVVLSTVGVGAGFNRPTLPSILAELAGVPVIDRTSMNAFEDGAFRDAVKKTDRKRLIIAGLHQIAERAHEKGLKIYAATLTPAGSTGTREDNRQAVNAWIRTAGAFDGVIDFDVLTRDPANPTFFLPQYDSGDHLHPNDAGYKAMGDFIDLALLRGEKDDQEVR